MAMIRSSSAAGNLFWSERANRELMINTTSPVELPPIPVDSDLEEVSVETAGSNVGKGKGGGPPSAERSRKRSGQFDQDGREQEATRSDYFRTPEVLEGKKQRVGESGDGRDPPQELDGGLEEALGKEVESWLREKELEEKIERKRRQREIEDMKTQNMQLLRDQNERLMKEIDKLRLERRVIEFQQQRKAPTEPSMSEWSAVSPPPPRMRSPDQERKPEKEVAKYTPRGTRVPD